MVAVFDKPRFGRQVPCDALHNLVGKENLAAVSSALDACRSVDGGAKIVAVVQRQFAKVQADADTQRADVRKDFAFDGLLNLQGTAGGRERRGECNHETIANGLDFVSAVLGNGAAQEGVVPLENRVESFL